MKDIYHREHRRHRGKFNGFANSFSVFSVEEPLAAGSIRSLSSTLITAYYEVLKASLLW
jgi:hypothetical protein